MKWLTTLLLSMLMLVSGCDKKSSQATINQMDATTKAAVAVSMQWSGQKDNIVAKVDAEKEIIASTIGDIDDTLKLIALGCQNYNDALAAKKQLSENSATKITEAKATLETLRLIVIQVCAKVKATDPDKEQTITIWKTMVVEKLDALILSFGRLNEVVQADLAAGKKK
jgi:hypothetical protein